MLVNLSNRGRKSASPKERRRYQWKFLLLLPLWVAISYFAARFIVTIILSVLHLFGISVADMANPAVVQAVMMCIIYGLTLGITMGVPYLIKDRETNLETLGLQRLMSWTDLGLAPMAYIVYGLIIATVSGIIMSLFPDFPINQEQDVGFSSLGSTYEYTTAFVALVVVAPLAEEALVRGYLYGKLRVHVPAYVAILATSLLFAVAHGQWNVAIDTFVLGVILAGLREITGSIWAGIVLHMIKNAIAFFSTFVPVMLLST